MNKKIVTSVIVLVIATALIYLASRYFSGASSSEGPPTAQASAPGDNRLAVDGVVLKPDSLRNVIRVTGSAIANAEVEMRSETSGLITQMNLREGSRVSRGQLLVKINDADLKAQRRQYELEMTLAKDTERRQKQLFERGAISQEDYDLALNRLNVIEAQLALVDAQIARTEIRAPFSGTIGLRYVDMGDYLTPATRITILQNIDSIKVDFSIPEQYAALVERGDRIEFRIAGSDSTFEGRIFAIEPRIDQASRSLPIRAISPNRSGRILPGSFVEIEYLLEELNDAVLIPTQSLIPQLQGQIVYVSRGGRATPVNVRTGIRSSTKIQILEGLALGDTVITTGILQLRDGLPVNVTSIR
jgi:membrane fusion protein (multidrug efflux system)